MKRKQGHANDGLAGIQGSPAATPQPTVTSKIEDLFALALEYQKAGHLDEAEQLCCQILLAEDRHADSLHLRGVIAYQKGRFDAAIEMIKNAISIKQNDSRALYHLGLAYNAQGRRADAIASYERAVELEPGYAEACFSLGNLLVKEGRATEAIARYDRVLALKPNYVEAYYNRGVLLMQQGKLNDAIVNFRQATILKPEFAEAHCNLGTALKNQGDLNSAIDSLRRAISLKAEYAEAHNNLGNVFKQQGALTDAIASYERAIVSKPDYADAYNNLGNVLKDQGKISDAVHSYKRALTFNPNFAVAYSNLLLCLNYDDNITTSELYKAHYDWGKQFGAAHSTPTGYGNTREAGRRLRIGYVSPDFCRHSVAHFLEPVLKQHNREAVEVYCYADVLRPDDVTIRLQGCADHWLFTIGLSDDDLASRIWADKIDILIDLAGHTANNRLGVFARKPAPIQVSWLGYPNTTGLDAIRYRLVDAVTDPINEHATASEILVRLPGGFLCYTTENLSLDASVPPSSATGVVTFGSFNNPAKLSPATLDTWANLLVALPRSRLLLKGMPFSDAATRALYLSRLIERGVAEERVELASWLPSEAAHLGLYDRVDIALDPFPYNGTTTTCEALWMGVPVVTLRGDRHSGRVGASLLTHIGLNDWIAESVSEYVDIARRLASDPPRLECLRRSLRSRLLASPIYDADAFARKIESAYRTMWNYWCKATVKV